MQSSDDEQTIFPEKLFKEINQYDTSVIGLGAIGSYGTLEGHGEMSKPTMTDRSVYKDLELFTQDWGRQVVISDKLFRNREFAKIESQVLNLSPMYYTTIQQYVEELYVRAIMGTNGGVWNNVEMNILANDKLPQFSTAHVSPLPEKSAFVPTQSNMFTNALTSKGVAAVRSAMSRFRDGDDTLLGVAGDTLLICDDPLSQTNAYAILGTATDPDQIVKRYNFLRGGYDLVSLKYAGARLQQLGWTGPLPWVMIDSQLLNRALAAVLVHFSEAYVDVLRDEEVKATKFIPRAEFAARFNIWQYAAVGGCPSGTTLDEAPIVPIDVNVIPEP
jgi:hypothetical protein